MKKGFLKKIFSPASGKRFSAWQVELTTRCPLQCRMCPKEEYPGIPAQDMNLDDFKKLLPYLKKVEAVVLEGWGESLLHKNLIQCIHLVKKEGARVGFVTSGKGLNEGYISELLQAEVDFLGFSLAGTSAKTHNSIRVNSDLDELLKHIRILQEMKVRKQLSTPRLHIVYLLLKDNILEVPPLIELAKDLGIGEVVLINLIHATNGWQDEQRVFAEKSSADFTKILKEAEEKARKWKIQIQPPSLSFREVAVCAENPLRNLYISIEGEVSPCVYLNPPLPSPFKRIFEGREFQTEKVSFGNLFRQPWPQVWDDKRYTEFRNHWARRGRKYEEMIASLWDRDKRKGLETGALPDPPEPCKTCYKMLGV